MNYRQMLDKFAEIDRRMKELEERVDFVENTREKTTTPIQPLPYPLPTNPWKPNFKMEYSNCPRCGIKLEGVMGYVCSQPHCPTGLGGPWCSTNGNTQV